MVIIFFITPKAINIPTTIYIILMELYLLTHNAPNPYLLNGNLPAHIDIYSFKADYSQPLKNNVTLEAGIKISYVKTDNDAQYTLFDTATSKWNYDDRSNHFIYKENINAAYVNLQKQFKKLSVQLGLRAEQTIADGNQVIKDDNFS